MDYGDLASRPTGPTLAESQGDFEVDVKQALGRVMSANTTAHS